LLEVQPVAQGCSKRTRLAWRGKGKIERGLKLLHW